MANNKFQVCFRIVVGTVALLLLTTEGVKLTTETSAHTATERRDAKEEGQILLDELFAGFDESGACGLECMGDPATEDDLADNGTDEGSPDGDTDDDGDTSDDSSNGAGDGGTVDYSAGFVYEDSASAGSADLFFGKDGIDWDCLEISGGDMAACGLGAFDMTACGSAPGYYLYDNNCLHVHEIKAKIRKFDLEKRASYQQARKEALGSGDTGAAALAKAARATAKADAREKHDSYKAAKHDFNSQNRLQKTTAQLSNVIDRSNGALAKHAARASAKAALFIADSYVRNQDIEDKKDGKAEPDDEVLAKRNKTKTGKKEVKDSNNEKFADWKETFKVRHNAWKRAAAKLQRHCLSAPLSVCEEVVVDGEKVCTVESGSFVSDPDSDLPGAVASGGGQTCQASNSKLVKLGLETHYFLPDGFNTPDDCKGEDLTAVFYDLSESCQERFRKLKVFIGGLEEYEDEDDNDS